MSNINEIEWSKNVTDKGNVIVIDRTVPANKIKNEDETIKKFIEQGLHGYVDGDKAIKIMDPALSQKSKNLNVFQHTLIKGDDSMDEKYDNKYSDLKEDLRESERRISNDISERELRFEKTIDRFMLDAKEREERYIKTAEETKNIVYEGEKSRKSNTIAMWTLAVTTIIGIAAMVITVVLNV